jgi:hypothetical protein
MFSALARQTGLEDTRRGAAALTSVIARTAGG